MSSIHLYHVMHHTAVYAYRVSVGSQEEDVKGQIKDLKASYVDVRIAMTDKETRKQMKKDGFTYVGEAYTMD